LGEGERVAELCRAEGIPIRVFPFRIWTSRFALFLQLLRFAQLLRKDKVDVLLPYVSYPNLVCGATWRLGGVKACWWQQRDEGMHRGPKLLEKAAVLQGSVFVSNSTPGFDFLTKSLGVPRERCHFVANGVEVGAPLKTRSEWRGEMGLEESAQVAVMLANLTSFKDHATLLRAWRLVVDDADKATTPVLLLAGRFGDTEKQAKALAYDLELGRSVRFLGAVDDIAGLLAASDLCVFSSLLEGCPNGVLEAMALGLAVAGTDIAGIRDAVGDAGADYLAAPESPADLARKIQTLLRDPDLRKAVGARNRERIHREFTLQRMCELSANLIARQLNGDRLSSAKG
jgi:glycosyltransferase involved in cell wall biosynthesis